jgi:hypothetical protein
MMVPLRLSANRVLRHPTWATRFIRNSPIPSTDRFSFQDAKFSLRNFTSNSDKENDSAVASTPAAGAWRKQQLGKLERKFMEPLKIDNDEDLQPMWKSMENRVSNRRLLTKSETGGRTGRSNVRRTDEDLWSQNGMYDQEVDDKDAKDESK